MWSASNKLSLKLPLSLALAGSVALVVACDGGKSNQQQAQALPVDVFEVVKMPVPVVSHLTGRANSTRKAEVRPQVSGVILKRSFVEGSSVKQGEQLYQIDPAVYEAQVDSARANLNSAKASMHTNQLKCQRYASLLEKKAVSKQDYDDAEAAYLQSKAAVEAAEASLKNANINLAYTKVYAPISGRIARSSVTEGALVSAQQATALTTITQLDPMYVDLGQSVEDNLQLREAIAQGTLQLRPDGKASVDVFLPDGKKYPYEGTIEFSEVTVDETTGMVNVRAIVPNPDGVLLPGMFMRADIIEGVRPDALVVSQNGVIREARGDISVYIVDQGKAKKVSLKLGPNYESYYVVEEGLKEGDQVIVSNIQKIRTGVPVMVVPPQAAQPQDAAQNGTAQQAPSASGAGE